MLFRRDIIVQVKSYSLAEKEHSQFFVLLLTLYVDYSKGNGLFSGTLTNVHRLINTIVE